MLALKNLTVSLPSSDHPREILRDVTLQLPLGHFCAILGPSGCGKTTLLRAIAGNAPGRETGEIVWNGRHLAVEDFHPAEMSYVPQFEVAHRELTVSESVHYALRLRRRRDPGSHGPVATLLGEVGLENLTGQQVSTLSGGQRRRLALAMELTSDPKILLCDEVTSGLDHAAEEEIMRVLTAQRTRGRLVLSVTHSLEHLAAYDSVVVLVDGRLAFHGPPSELVEYFAIQSPRELYSHLGSRPAEEWADSWAATRDEAAPEPAAEEPATRHATPGIFTQLAILLERRARIFLRSKTQPLVHLAFTFGFPAIVAIFAWNGLPEVRRLGLGLRPAGLEEFSQARAFLVDSTKAGTVVSGLVLFQVILMTLMGANNGAREIAGERAIFEQEKLAGLSPLAYVGSKAAFLFGLAIVQAGWMGFFVHGVCGFPGSLPAQAGYLLLANLAMTGLCLGISSLTRSAEKASLFAVYCVGFQLPLSGAVLALPEPLGALLRPIISAYAGWSGLLQTLRNETYYDVAQAVAQSPLLAPAFCVLLLTCQSALGLLVAWYGCHLRRTE